MTFSLTSWLKNKKSNLRGMRRSRRRSAVPGMCEIRFLLEPLEDRVLLAAVPVGIVDPNPADGLNNFGAIVQPLRNGNVVITSPGDDANGSNRGAVYLFNGETNHLISTLWGSSFNVSNSGVRELSNGNFVVRNSFSNGLRGAVTWGDGTIGWGNEPTVISADNSLVGERFGDNIGNGGVTLLSNGNYLVLSSSWAKSATVSAAGAVTWGSGTEGVSGKISADNSLVGTKRFDLTGASVTALSNDNYVVSSPVWDNSTVLNVGAVTWGSGTTGLTGPISALNSLVGSKSNDRVGSGGVMVLSNGNYVVSSPIWDNGTLSDAGAVTFGNGTTGVLGAITLVNSDIGTTAYSGLQSVVVDNSTDTFFGLYSGEVVGRVGSQDFGFPSITAPSGQTAYEDVEQAIDGISIVDAGDAVLTFTLDVSHGTLSLGTIPVTLAVAGNGTGSLTLIGTSADINAALDSLVYRADLNFSGGDTLALALTDNFLSGYETSVALNVVSATQQATSLQALVSTLQTSDVLNEGLASSLIVKLNLEGDAGDIDRVQDFLNQVEAFRRARVLTQDQADELAYWGNILLLSVTQR